MRKQLENTANKCGFELNKFSGSDTRCINSDGQVFKWYLARDNV